MTDVVQDLMRDIWEREPRIRALRKELEEELEKNRLDLMAIKQECEGSAL